MPAKGSASLAVNLPTIFLWLHAVGEDLLKPGNATEYALEYGTYTGFMIKLDPSVDAQHLCFYVPDIGVCLIDDDFLSCEQQSSCTQHERNDVIHIRDNETMRIITVNFRMMPPDDEKDEAYVIRLYNHTVVWLTDGECLGLSHVLSQEWKPRIYMYYNNLSNCTTNPTTTWPKITDSTCPACSMTASPTSTSISINTPTAEAGQLFIHCTYECKSLC